MEIGDCIYFIEKSNIFYTKNKKYEIIDYWLENDNPDKKYLFFYNDLNATDWFLIKDIKKRGFVDKKEYRKHKLNEICKR